MLYVLPCEGSFVSVSASNGKFPHASSLRTSYRVFTFQNNDAYNRQVALVLESAQNCSAVTLIFFTK